MSELTSRFPQLLTQSDEPRKSHISFPVNASSPLRRPIYVSLLVYLHTREVVPFFFFHRLRDLSAQKTCVDTGRKHRNKSAIQFTVQSFIDCSRHSHADSPFATNSLPAHSFWHVSTFSHVCWLSLLLLVHSGCLANSHNREIRAEETVIQ